MRGSGSCDRIGPSRRSTTSFRPTVSVLGERLNHTASAAFDGVDVVCLVLDATQPLGRGDRYVAARCPSDLVVVVNKIDRASRAQVAGQLARRRRAERRGLLPRVGPHR